LINSSYSRDFEREADAHALKEMKKLGVSTIYMADLFEALAKKTDEEEDSSKVGHLMASHPLTSERIMYFKKYAHP
jgi:predicted Zn-dependent protease